MCIRDSYNIQYHISFFQLHDKEPHTSQEQPNHQNQEMKRDTVYCSLQYYYSKDKIIPFEEVGQEVFFRGRKSVDLFLLDKMCIRDS